MTDAQYSKHFQRSGKWSYVFLEWIATYINRERKTKINLLLNLLQLTLSHLFKSRIRFKKEQYRNPVLNSATYLWIWHFPNRNKMFLRLNFWLFFGFFLVFFFDKLFHSLVQHFVQQFYAISAMLYLDLSWGNSVNMEYLCTVANSIRDFSASNTLSFDQPVYRWM